MTSIVDLALAVVGATANDGSMRYEDIIATQEPEIVAAEMDRMSGCGLVVRGLWRRWLEELGLPVPAPLAAPYRPGTVFGTLYGIAVRAGATEAATAAPQLGDVVWLDAPEHVELYVGKGCYVAGGQRTTAGTETVLCVSRTGRPTSPSSLEASHPNLVVHLLPPRRVLRLLRWDPIADYLARGGA